MKNNIVIKTLLFIFASTLLFSCSPKNYNIDFDFTTLKKSKKIKAKNNVSKDKDEKYKLNGFKTRKSGLFEMWFVFLGGKEVISSYLKVQDKDGERFKTYKITSLLSHGPRRIMVGTCKKFDKKL